jgi:glyoxylase-like metal-dependent hydrolase (beta-lactamase superfamily II)
MILKAIDVGMYMTNCYVVGSDSTKKGVIIDPGDDGNAILDIVKKSGLSIDLIIATHMHPDHIGALKMLKEQTGAQFGVHEDEWGGVVNTISQIVGGAMVGSPGRPPQPEKLLKDGDTIDIDDLHFKIIHTPGHSPGGICLYGHGILFSGDTLFNFGIGRTDFPGCSTRQIMESLQNKLMALPDETIVYPGHGPSTTIGQERRGNPFLRMPL